MATLPSWETLDTEPGARSVCHKSCIKLLCFLDRCISIGQQFMLLVAIPIIVVTICVRRDGHLRDYARAVSKSLGWSLSSLAERKVTHKVEEIHEHI